MAAPGKTSGGEQRRGQARRGSAGIAGGSWALWWGSSVAGPKTAPPVNIWGQSCCFEARTSRLEVPGVRIGSHLASGLIGEWCWRCCSLHPSLAPHRAPRLQGHRLRSPPAPKRWAGSGSVGLQLLGRYGVILSASYLKGSWLEPNLRQQ